MKKYISRLCILAFMATVTVGCQSGENQKTAYTETMPAQNQNADSETITAEAATGASENSSEITDTTEAAILKETEQTESSSIEEVLDMDKIVGETIIKQSRGMYHGYECAAEGHIILDTEEKDGIMTIYAQTMYGEYQFHNEDYFVRSAGTGVIPCVMEFLVNEKGSYKLRTVQWPEDGSRYAQSIQEMFPEELWDTCISPTEEARAQLMEQERAYAREYLKKLGREAQIGDYADFEYMLLTEAGVSVEASNALLVHEKLFGSYPNWIGSEEMIEDGIRYVYRKEVDQAAGRIILTKTEYTTGKLVESNEFDWQTGQPIASEGVGAQAAVSGTYDIILTSAPALVLQDMLSSIYGGFEILSGGYEWGYLEDGQMLSVVACGADPREYVKEKPRLEIPRYNGMEEVGYSVSCQKEPSSLVVKEYYRAALNDSEAEPVSVQSYDEIFIIKLKPNRYYELIAVWDEADVEVNGFYGSAEYALVTEV